MRLPRDLSGRDLAGLKPYPEMRDSGVEWLGEVPEHWEVRRLKTLCDMRSGDAITAMSINEVGKYPVFGGNGIRGYAARYTHDGNFVLIGRQGALCGNVHIARGRFWASEHAVVAALRRKHILEWFGALLEIMNLNQYSFAAAQPGLSVDRVLNLWVSVPPADEQTAIARFLHDADQRIGRYIRTKEDLIELLEEQKQAIIHLAVTGQIDVRTGQPYPAYKDSGVEWLGEVPAHWEVTRARYVFREVDQRSRYGSEPHLSMSQRLGLVPSHLVENRTLVSQSYAGGKLCEVEDLVLNRLKAHLGVVALARHQGVVSSDYTVLRLKKPGTMAFFESVLRSSGCRRELQIRTKGIVEGFWRLYTDDLNEIRLPVPRLEEQFRIAAWLGSTGDQVNRLVASANRHIGLLREYRTRLIADVVTGKFDVREAAAALPRLRSARGREPGQHDHTTSHPQAIERGITKETIP